MRARGLERIELDGQAFVSNARLVELEPVRNRSTDACPRGPRVTIHGSVEKEREREHGGRAINGGRSRWWSIEAPRP
jgi:hypothetical protein